MSLSKQEYKKNIILGIYEVLDISGYELIDAEKVVETIRGLVDGYEFSDEDLANSHYAYVVYFLKEINEWVKVEENLDNTIKQILKTAGLNSKTELLNK